MIDIRKLREIAQSATPGPWEPKEWCSDFVDNSWAGIGPVHTQRDNEDELDPDSDAGMKAIHDSVHIAAFNPQTALELLSRIEKLERDRDISVKALKKIAQGLDRNTFIYLPNVDARDALKGMGES